MRKAVLAAGALGLGFFCGSLPVPTGVHPPAVAAPRAALAPLMKGLEGDPRMAAQILAGKLTLSSRRRPDPEQTPEAARPAATPITTPGEFSEQVILPLREIMEERRQKALDVAQGRFAPSYQEQVRALDQALGQIEHTRLEPLLEKISGAADLSARDVTAVYDCLSALAAVLEKNHEFNSFSSDLESLRGRVLGRCPVENAAAKQRLLMEAELKSYRAGRTIDRDLTLASPECIGGDLTGMKNLTWLLERIRAQLALASREKTDSWFTPSAQHPPFDKTKRALAALARIMPHLPPPVREEMFTTLARTEFGSWSNSAFTQTHWADAVLDNAAGLDDEQVRRRLLPLLPALLSTERMPGNEHMQQAYRKNVLTRLSTLFAGRGVDADVCATLGNLGYGVSAPTACGAKTRIARLIELPAYIGIQYPGLGADRYEDPVVFGQIATRAPDPQTLDALTQFHKMRDRFLELNYALLIETGAAAPSCVQLASMLEEFSDLYARMAQQTWAIDDEKLGLVDTGEITRRCRAVGKLLKSNPQDARALALRLRADEEQAQALPAAQRALPETRLINLMHQQLEMLSGTPDLNGRELGAEYVTRINTDCPIQIFNLTPQPLFAVKDGRYECLDELVFRIITLVKKYGARAVSAQITVLPGRVDVDLRIRSHGTHLSITRTGPEEGGSMSFYFSGPVIDSDTSLWNGEVERAHAIAGALKFQCGLDPQVEPRGPVKYYLGAFKGVFNINTGLNDIGAMEDLAALGIMSAFEVYSGLSRDESAERVARSLVLSAGREQKMDRMEDVERSVGPELNRFMNAELARLGLAPMDEDSGTLDIPALEAAFTRRIEDAVFSSQVLLDEAGLPVANPGFAPETTGQMREVVRSKDALVLAAALPQVRRKLAFTPVSRLGSLEVCQSVSGFGNERLVVRALRMPESGRVLFARAFISRPVQMTKTGMSRVEITPLGLPQALEALDRHHHLYSRNLLEGLQTFGFDPFENEYQRMMLETSDLMPVCPMFLGQTISASQEIVCGRIKIDRETGDFGLEKGDLLVSFGFRPKCFDTGAEAPGQARSPSQAVQALWVTGQGNILCHDASMVREQNFPVFYLKARIDEHTKTVTLTDGFGRSHVVREGQTVFFDARNNSLGIWGIDGQGRQDPFYEHLGHYVRRHMRGTNYEELLPPLVAAYRALTPERRLEALPVIFYLYTEHGISGLDILVRLTRADMLKPALDQQFARFTARMKNVENDLRHDLESARTSFERAAVRDRFLNDCEAIRRQIALLGQFEAPETVVRRGQTLENELCAMMIRTMGLVYRRETTPAAESPAREMAKESAIRKYFRDPDHWFAGMEVCSNLDPELKNVLGDKAARLIDIREDEGFGLGVEGARRLRRHLQDRVDSVSGRTLWQEIVEQVDGLVDDGLLLETVKQTLARNGGLPDSFRADFARHFRASGFGSVAVRSSGVGEDGADHSFAGVGRSLVNIRGEEDVMAAVVAVTASGSTRRVADYLASVGDPRREIEMPVWIHPTVKSRYSAVVFTRNPGTGRKQIIIQPTRGMLAPVVDGRVSADEIVFELRRGKWVVVGPAVVSDKVFYELASETGNGTRRLINAVDPRRSFSLPVEMLDAILQRISRFESESRLCLDPAFVAGADFEVAIDDRVQIVQVRPITTGKLRQPFVAGDPEQPLRTSA